MMPLLLVRQQARDGALQMTTWDASIPAFRLAIHTSVLLFAFVVIVVWVIVVPITAEVLLLIFEVRPIETGSHFAVFVRMINEIGILCLVLLSFLSVLAVGASDVGVFVIRQQFWAILLYP